MRLRLLLAVLLLALPASARPASGQASERILVMPFENVARENRIFWLSEASAVLLADDLNALGARAITREERREAFERLQVPPATALTDASVIRIGQLVGASQVVVGTFELEGEELLVRARSIELEPGRLQATAAERGSLPDLYAIFERIARRLAPRSAGSPQEIEHAHPPVAAFENYIKGLVADTPATAIGYQNMALQAHPAFVRPRIALWEIFADQDDHDLALAALLPIPDSAPQARRVRFLMGLSQLQLGRYDDAIATYRALADARSTANALNNLGVAYLRRGRSSAVQAAHYFDRAAETDEADSDYFFNLGYAYWFARDTEAVIYWLREAVRRNPADADAHFVLAAALSAAGSTTEAERELELARRLSSTYEEWEKRPASDPVPAGLERVKSDVELPNTRWMEDAVKAPGQRDQLELAQFHLERGQRLFEQELDREALAELARVVFLTPYESAAHLLIGRVHLRGGRTAEAIDALKISLWSRETAEAHAALAETYLEARDHEAARSEAQRALQLDPASTAATQVLERLAASGPTSR